MVAKSRLVLMPPSLSPLTKTLAPSGLTASAWGKSGPLPALCATPPEPETAPAAERRTVAATAAITPRRAARLPRRWRRTLFIRNPFTRDRTREGPVVGVGRTPMLGGYR